jgi:hypothetical protein
VRQPTISRILAKTGQLKDRKTVAKRFLDVCATTSDLIVTPTLSLTDVRLQLPMVCILDFPFGSAALLTEIHIFHPATWSACPIHPSTSPSELVELMRRHEDPSSKVEADPRAFLAIARVNWLHSHYPIVR